MDLPCASALPNSSIGSTQGEAEQISMPVNAVKPGSEHANDSYNDIPQSTDLGIGILVSKAVVEVMDASALPNSSLSQQQVSAENKRTEEQRDSGSMRAGAHTLASCTRARGRAFWEVWEGEATNNQSTTNQQPFWECTRSNTSSKTSSKTRSG